MRSDPEWIQWGKVDPLWAVCTVPGKQKSGGAPWTDTEFYSSGEAAWKVCERAWKYHGLVNTENCLEIGCGAGRITRALAQTFCQVHAVDVSPDMIEYAKQNIHSGNVHWHLTSGSTLPLPDHSVAAAFSILVFRHFDHPNDGLAYFQEIYRVLKPGGALMIEIPLYEWPVSSKTWRGRLGRRLFGTIHETRMALQKAIADFQRWRRKPVMRGIYYNAEELYKALTAMGFVDIDVRVMGTLGSPWVFATKPL